MKTCTRCGEVKPLSEFYPNRRPNRRTQHRPECKDCTKRRLREGPSRAAYMQAYRQRQRDGET